MAPRDAPAPGHVEHVAHAQKLLGPLLAQNGAAVDLGRHLKADPRGEIGLDRAGDDIDRGALRGHDEVDAARPRHLRKALDAGLDLLARDHHQVGHLVDDHHDIGHPLGREFIGLEHRLAGLVIESGLHRAREHLALLQRLIDARVIAVDVAHAHLRHLAIAVLHLGHHPFERDHGLFRVGHHRRQQMRNAVIDAEFQHLGVDHDEAALVGGELVEKAQDHGVDRHGFARPGGPGNQQVGHLGEVGDHRIAADILAQRQGQFLPCRRHRRGPTGFRGNSPSRACHWAARSRSPTAPAPSRPAPTAPPSTARYRRRAR